MDIVTTVPKNFRYGGKTGLAAWVAEGCLPGESDPEELAEFYVFSTFGARPKIEPGERVYIVCEGLLRGYAPLVELRFRPAESGFGNGHIELIRQGGAVSVTIPDPIVGFRGWRYAWWSRALEVPFPGWYIGEWDRIQRAKAFAKEDRRQIKLGLL